MSERLDSIEKELADLRAENKRLQAELDCSCNAEELRQVRAENAALRQALKVLLEGQSKTGIMPQSNGRHAGE